MHGHELDCHGHDHTPEGNTPTTDLRTAFWPHSNWHLKYTVTMQTPTTHAHKHISSIIISAVLNVHPFLHTWLGCLLSLTSWAQLAVLSGYTRSTVLRALHSAVPRIMSRTPWDVDSTLQWCCYATYILPCTRDTLFFRLHRWLQSQTVWSDQAYASWHMPHAGPCGDFCADWCHDFPILSHLTSTGSVDINPFGASAPGGGVYGISNCM